MPRRLLLLAVFGLGLAAAQALADPVSGKGFEDKHIQVLEHRPSAPHPTIGSESAPVTFEFFLNLQNARSLGPYRTILGLAKRHPKRLRVVFRLTDTRERNGSLAQVFGREAFEQGRFFEFVEAFYSKRHGKSASKDYPEVATKAGVDYSGVQEALESMRHDDFLNANHFYWRRMHVPAVPGLLINGHRPTRVGSQETLEALYDQAYEESMTALAKGVPQEGLQDYLRRKHMRPQDGMRRLSGPIDIEPGETPPKSPRVIRMHELLKGQHSQGPDDARVPLVFVCHLQSNQCRTMVRHLRLLRKAYKDDVRLIVHPLFNAELPRQDKAQLMHEAALCADEQEAFWEYYYLAFEQQRRLNFDQSFAVDLAASPLLDLDIKRFETCLESGRHSARVQEQVDLVRKTGVTHVPAIAVGGLLYSARLHFDQLRVLVDTALAPGLLESHVDY